MSKKNYVLEALEKSLIEYQKLHDELEKNLNHKYDMFFFNNEFDKITNDFRNKVISYEKYVELIDLNTTNSSKSLKLYYKYHGKKWLYYLDLQNEYYSAIQDLKREIEIIKFYGTRIAKLNN